MHILLESHEREWLSLGAAVSIALHSAMVGLIVLAYQETPDKPGFTEQFVTYLVPPDRPLGRQGSAEQAAWQGSAATGGGGEEAAPAEGELTGGPLAAGEPQDTVSTPELVDPLEGLLGDSVLTEIEVDSTVQRHPESAAPTYPAQLLARAVEGSAFVAYVVDSTGRVDTTSFRVIRATHPEFALAVRRALPGMRFRPALLAGIPVRQLVQQSFSFKIQQPDSVPPRRPTQPM
jgi:TonB family protein